MLRNMLRYVFQAVIIVEDKSAATTDEVRELWQAKNRITKLVCEIRYRNGKANRGSRLPHL